MRRYPQTTGKRNYISMIYRYFIGFVLCGGAGRGRDVEGGEGCSNEKVPISME